MRWLGPASTPAAAATLALPSWPEDDAALLTALGAAGLDVADALARMGGDGQLYRRSLRLFAQHHRSDAAALRQSATGAALRGRAHAITGGAGTLGARALQHRACEVELAAAAGGDQAADPALQVAAGELAADLDRLLGQIDTLLGAEQPTGPTASAAGDGIDWPRVRALLDTMQPLLDEHDTAVIDLCEQATPVLEPALGALARTLAQAISAFDFELAQRIHAQALAQAQAALQSGGEARS